MLYTHPSHSHNDLIGVYKHSSTTQETLLLDSHLVKGLPRRLTNPLKWQIPSALHRDW